MTDAVLLAKLLSWGCWNGSIARFACPRYRIAFKDVPTHLKPYTSFLNDILPQLHAVEDSWRNKVSHVDGRIVIADVFTEEMASGIYNATIILMKKLAGGLPAPDSSVEG